MIIRPTSLIFSSPSDVHVSAVLEHFDRGGTPYIVDFRHFGKSFGGTLQLGAGVPLSFHTKNGDYISLENLQTIWWRRPQPLMAQSHSDAGILHYVNEEFLRFWQSSLAILRSVPDVHWYNPYKHNEIADCKFRQLEVAALSGFEIPDTVVTTSHAEALAFIKGKNYEVIFKSFAGNEGFWQPTRKYDPSYDRLLVKHLNGCPVIFQEYIDGIADYRAIVIDDDIFAVRFDLAATRYKYDVRIDTANPAAQAVLPLPIQEHLHRFMKEFGLNYGAFDLRETKDGRFVFFEVNPAGQFLYLDQIAGTRIAAAMAAALGRTNARRRSQGRDPVATAAEFRSLSERPFAAAVPDRVAHV